MEITILKEEKINLKYIKCHFYIRDWSGFVCSARKIPFSSENYWNPVIDVDEGKIIDWEKGVTLNVNAKTCDDNELYLYDENNNLIIWFDNYQKETVHFYRGYVPEFLDVIGDGCGDYLQLIIDRDGYIKNFNKEEIINIIEKEEY